MADHDGKYPKTNDEYMEHIIKEGMIQLPELPPGQEYFYDPSDHELKVGTIVEPPADGSAPADAQPPATPAPALQPQPPRRPQQADRNPAYPARPSRIDAIRQPFRHGRRRMLPFRIIRLRLRAADYNQR